jgi:preprotein translocase subunit Sec61beta
MEAGNGQRKASPLQVARAVFSAFFGVRKRGDHEAIKLTPVQVIVAGLIGAGLFVTTLLLLVKFILSRAA